MVENTFGNTSLTTAKFVVTAQTAGGASRAGTRGSFARGSPQLAVAGARVVYIDANQSLIDVIRGVRNLAPTLTVT
jgi:hypothetical protein